MLRILIILLIQLSFSGITTSTYSKPRQFSIKSDVNSDYLPYRFEILKADSTLELCYPTKHKVRVLKPAFHENDSSSYLRLNNPMIIEGTNSWFSYRTFPEYLRDEDRQIKCIVEDWSTYHDTILNEDIVIGVGRQDNSIVIFKCHIHKDTSIDYMTLLKQDVNSKLTGSTKICLFEDYDFDGNLELFINLNFNEANRSLVCIDLRSWSIEWKVDVASPIGPNSLFSCNNENNPSIIFTTINPGNGKHDKYFNDIYSYLVIINQNGEIILNKKIGKYPHYLPKFEKEKINNTFYLSHIENIDELDNDTAAIAKRVLSIIDFNGSIIKSIPVSDKIYYLRSGIFGFSRQNLLFVNYSDKYYKVYETSLDLIAFSETSAKNIKIIGSIKIENEPDSIYVFSDGLYDYNFKKILSFPCRINFCESFRYDKYGNTVELLINTLNISFIGRISKKTNFELASVYYHNNQIYILVVLSGLFVGLFLTIIYQKRTKKNLNLIASQKSELEKAHQILKDTQQKLIEAEKYKQAKDIAGGFAHEIRNALFPVDGSLNKLFKINKPEQYDREKFEDYYNKIKRSTNRAISMTELISQYTKLDSEYIPEVVCISKIVNEVTETNKTRIDEQNIKIKIEGDSDSIIESNNKQLYIVFSNLLGNVKNSV